MAGWPIAQVRRPDGMVFTLYRGGEPLIHALSSIDAWALCIDLPATGTNDTDAASDWGLTATIDGRSIIAANATLGVAVDIPLWISPSAGARPSRRRRRRSSPWPSSATTREARWVAASSPRRPGR